MKTIPVIFLTGLLMAVHSLSAQFSDDFSDGDFTQNPVWSGDSALFLVNTEGELQSAGLPATDTIFLSTRDSLSLQKEWRFYLRYEFAPSTSNLIRIYLVSDTPTLTDALHGYFVGAGESGNEDSYDLFRQDGTTITKIIDGIPGRAASQVHCEVKVQRDSAGNWSLYSDEGGNGNFSLEGTAFDTTYTQPAWLGIWIRHSSTRANAFFFDDFFSGNGDSDTVIAPPPPVKTFHFHDLLITEIMADPTPSAGLPEAEFLELYNPGPDTINLGGFSVSNGTTTGVLGEKQMLPDSYIILSSAASAAQFFPYGEIISPSAWPALVNGGDNLGFRSPGGVLIDTLDYSLNWYRDPEKQTGGYSLERTTMPGEGCPESFFWSASVSPEGGTPGKVNSRWRLTPDSTKVTLLTTAMVDSSTIRLCFSRPLDEGAAIVNQNYRLVESGENPEAVWLLSPENVCADMLFARKFDAGNTFEIEIDSLKDCTGGWFSGHAVWSLPAKPDPGDVLINEILFNPYSGGSDFVEVVNMSDKILDFSQLWIGKGEEGSDSVYNSYPLASQTTLFYPGEIICLTKDTLMQQQTYLPPGGARFWQMKGFPGFEDGEGICVITREGEGEVDRMKYKDDYHFSGLSDREGVSLERISLRNASMDRGNWHSAASGVRYATPGYANSQSLELDESESAVSLEYQTFTPDGDGEKDVLPVNYHFDFPGANARVAIFDIGGRKVKTIQPNTLLGTQPGTIFWDGTNDLNQQALAGMYILLFEVQHPATGERLQYRQVAVLSLKW
ncbi:MAG: lamin tail domain-containing protein [Bacteroidia bacterium]